jgi:predicted ATPase/transcriptional regulator with XRE-family HTH domain/Tfp pilus assembly protein PilF
MTNSFGDWIKQRRRALDLTQHELAEQVACSVITIQKLEAGARRPSQQMLKRLADCLQLSGDDRPAFLQQGRAQRRAPDHGSAAPLSPEAYGVALPSPLTPLIGRDHELASLVARIQRADTRLLTCLGPAGVGKTRLSLEVAARIQEVFRDGTIVVPLAPLRDAQLLPMAIARALHIQVTSAVPRDDLIVHLRGRQLLLVLDNFEHIVLAAPTLTQLLQACPALKMLVTSRARLRVRGERVFSLAPLGLPNLGQLPGGTLQDVPSVALFCEIAQALDPEFVPAPETLGPIAQICTRLDGLPLAIEIVATHSRALPPGLLLKQVDRQLLLSADGPQDLPARHRTLRAAFDWSYALLDAGQQRSFRSLAIFAAGWSSQAAAAVCGDAQAVPLPEMLATLEALVDHSLIYRIGSASQPAFALLEPIREYALEQLAAHRQVDQTRQRHALYYLELLEIAAPEMRGGQFHSWAEELQREHDNIRITLAWLIGSEQYERAGQLCVDLRRFWWSQGHLSEALSWIERLDAVIDTLPLLLQAQLWYTRGMLAAGRSDLSHAEQWYRVAMARARGAGDLWVIGACANGLGIVLAEQQRYAEAQGFLEEGLQVDQQLGERNDMAMSLASLAGLHYHQGNYGQAAQLFEASLAIHRKLGDIHSVALMLNNLGEIAWRTNQAQSAQRALDEALLLARQLDAHRLLPYVLNNLGILACRRGDEHAARAAFGEAIEQLGRTGDRAEIVISLLGIATLASRLEAPEHSARLLGTIEAAEQAGIVVLTPAAAADLRSLIVEIRALLGEHDYARQHAAGGCMSLDQAIAGALSF